MHSEMRFRTTVVPVLLVAAAVFGVTVAEGREIVVDQNHAKAGDDNPGTAELPLKAIGKGLAAAAAGDTVLVKGGTYREDVRFEKSGTAEKPIVLRAAPGGRVVVSGADPVGNWRKVTKDEARGNPNWQKIYVAEIGYDTRSVFQDGRHLALSRYPKGAKTKVPAQGGDSRRLVDAAHLTQPAGFWEGGLLTVRDASTTNYDRGLITGYDPEKHELVVDKARRVAVEAGKDEYYIKNVVSIITQPGEWAVDRSKKPARLFLWPLEDADPNECLIEASCRGARRLVSWADGVGHIKIDGLEIAQALDAGVGGWGAEKGRGHDIELSRCIIHHNLGHGVDVGFQKRLTVRNCIVACNGRNGIDLTYVHNCLVEENMIHGNAVDGIVFGWYANNNRAVRNCVHNQWSMSHPDGFQTFRNVNGLELTDNLFFNVGQGWQSQTTHQAKVIGNMWIGSRGGTLNLSPRDYKPKTGEAFGPCADFLISGNTLAYNGINNVTVLTTFTVANNVMESMGYLQKTGDWRRDYNLYIDYRSTAKARPFGRKIGGGKFAEENDKHSLTAYPKFRNAPEAMYQVNSKKFRQCTPSKLFLKMRSGSFAVGDHVELNWDGRVRKVTEGGEGYIVFDPPLPRVHPFGWDVVCNWRAGDNFALDLRLADDSPGRGMGEGGRDVGSTVDIQAYMKGDFNGDGRRDVPPAVKALQYEIHTFDE